MICTLIGGSETHCGEAFVVGDAFIISFTCRVGACTYSTGGPMEGVAVCIHLYIKCIH